MFGIDDALIWMPLAGAVMGALTNNKKPLKGALMGAGMGAAGGLLGPALGAAGGASGSAGGLLGAGAEAGAMSVPTAFGGMSTTAALAPTSSALGSGGATLGQSAIASGAATPSIWDTAQTAMKGAKPFVDAAGTGMQVANAMTPKTTPYQPVQGMPLPQRNPADYSLSGVSADKTVMDEAEFRKKLMAQYAQNALGR